MPQLNDKLDREITPAYVAYLETQIKYERERARVFRWYIFGLLIGYLIGVRTYGR